MKIVIACHINCAGCEL